MSDTPTPAQADEKARELVKAAIRRGCADEINGKPAGDILVKGCTAAKYIHPEDAAETFVDCIADEVLAALRPEGEAVARAYVPTDTIDRIVREAADAIETGAAVRSTLRLAISEALSTPPAPAQAKPDPVAPDEIARLTNEVKEQRAAKERAQDLLDQSVKQTSAANERRAMAELACKAAWDSIIRFPGSVHDRAMAKLEKVLKGRNFDYPADPVAPAGVRIRPLEWESGDGIVHDTLSWRAEVKPLGLTYCVVERQWWLVGEHSAANLCESDEAAKAAAQADYEARINSSLLPPSTEAQAGSPAEALPSQTSGEEAVAWRDVLAERRRQVEVEGWTPEHDNEHDKGEMADAAALYASLRVRHITGFAIWPWDAKWFKPTIGNHRRDLVKAIALLLAEIERLDRKEAAR